MAVPAISPQTESLPAAEPEFSRVQIAAAQLLAETKSRSEVARLMESYLITPYQQRANPTKRRMLAMRKLRRWSRRKDFRDLVYQYSLERLDSKTPDILDGVVRRASAGRIDAAKFALELAGRYTPRNVDQPTSVHIVLGQVPRPPQAEVVDGEVLEEEG